MPPTPARMVLEWLALGATIGALAGLGSATFLWLLDAATTTRRAHHAWVWALPLGGALIGAAMERLGPRLTRGNELVLDALRGDGAPLPRRMPPIVVLSSVATHLFGGSAGREGTAVQLGASVADWVARSARVTEPMRRQLVAAGVAGGFGAVFGTPLAGTVFALELGVGRRLRVDALAPAVIAATVGDAVTRRLGIHHAPYPRVPSLPLDAATLEKWALFAAVVALAAVTFVELTRALRRLGARVAPRLPARMLLGGLAVVALWRLAGTDDYLGLGVPTILRAFDEPALGWQTSALKLLFTSVTLGAGFMGGEVTPLFFVGATLGSSLSAALGLPIALGAGVGMAATFGAAADAPLALCCMAVELMGIEVLPHALVVSVAATWLTGRHRLYR